MTTHNTGRGNLEIVMAKAIRREHAIEERHKREVAGSIYAKKRIRDPEAYEAVKAFNLEHGLSVRSSKRTKEEALLHFFSNKKSKISLAGGYQPNSSGFTQAESKAVAEANAEAIASLKVIINALEGVAEQVRDMGSKSNILAKHLIDGIEHLRRTNKELKP